MEKNKISLRELLVKIKYLRLLLRKFWLLLLVLFTVGGLLGGGISYAVYSPEYEVTQAFTVKVENHPSASSATVSDNQLSKTIPSLLSSDTFINYMKPYMKSSGVKGSFRVTSLEHSNIFYITAKSSSNDNCLTIINELQKHYNEVARGVIGDSTMKFLAPPAMSKLPSNVPNYNRGILIGAFALLLLVLAVLVLIAYYTKTVTSADELQDSVNAPCLIQLHQVYHKRRSGESKKEINRLPLVVDENADLRFRQEIASLTANCERICREKNYKSILVASSASGEGKSSVSLNLACDLADRGRRVVLVDFDLRAPSIAQMLDINSIPTQLYDALMNESYDCAVQTGIEGLFLAGNIESRANAFDKLTSDKLQRLVDELKKQFDYVIIDSSPIGLLGDAIQIGEIVDSYIFVIAYNSVSKSYALRSLSSFDDSNSEMLGFVLNHIV